jgi:hypothetical protein
MRVLRTREPGVPGPAEIAIPLESLSDGDSVQGLQLTGRNPDLQ